MKKERKDRGAPFEFVHWDACIDESFRPVDLSTKVVMIPDKISEIINVTQTDKK